jgi:divalent metal cation (Fe/Co/Zn/Cd) transporter
MTGSVALYSDALERIVNVVTAGQDRGDSKRGRPPDAEHPYCHQKAEYFSAMAVGAPIVGADLTILWGPISRYESHTP